MVFIPLVLQVSRVLLKWLSSAVFPGDALSA